MILLKQASRYEYDVFSGTGFNTWSRVRKHHWGVVGLLGEPINRAQAKELLEVIEKYPHGNVDTIVL